MEVILEKFTKYFRSVLHHNQRYFLSFCVIEVLNILLVYFNFWLTDWEEIFNRMNFSLGFSWKNLLSFGIEFLFFVKIERNKYFSC